MNLDPNPLLRGDQKRSDETSGDPGRDTPKHWWQSRRTDAKAPGLVRIGALVGIAVLGWAAVYLVVKHG